MTTTQLPACMGGLCAHRDHCGRHLTDRRRFVVERLCQRGDEHPEPVFVVAFVGGERAIDKRDIREAA